MTCFNTSFTLNSVIVTDKKCVCLCVYIYIYNHELCLVAANDSRGEGEMNGGYGMELKAL